MDSRIDLEQYLTRKYARRQLVFKEAASVSVLMHGVTFLSKHFYALLDLYTRLYMRLFLRHKEDDTPEQRAARLAKLDADATDTYHVCWCVITFLCCCGGWYLTDREGETEDYWLWTPLLLICVYRVFEILAALIEIYFGRSDAKHHQFRILIHAALHYLTAGFAFALLYIFVDWQFDSFNTPGETADDDPDYQFNEMFDPIYQSLLAVITLGVNMEPANWIGKLLVLFQVAIGMSLATFIFLNITQIWLGERDTQRSDDAAKTGVG